MNNFSESQKILGSGEIRGHKGEEHLSLGQIEVSDEKDDLAEKSRDSQDFLDCSGGDGINKWDLADTPEDVENSEIVDLGENHDLARNGCGDNFSLCPQSAQGRFDLGCLDTSCLSFTVYIVKSMEWQKSAFEESCMEIYPG